MTGTPSSNDPTFATGSAVPSSASGRAPVAGSPSGASPSAPVKRRRRGQKFLWGVVVLLIVGAALWTWASVTFSYANSEKRGYVQKLSRQGWVCKTWEGQLSVAPIPGTTVQSGVFNFTVRDDSLAAALLRSTGALIALQYEEHRGVPTTCFGETNDYVTGFQRVP